MAGCQACKSNTNPLGCHEKRTDALGCHENKALYDSILELRWLSRNPCRSTEKGKTWKNPIITSEINRINQTIICLKNVL